MGIYVNNQLGTNEHVVAEAKMSWLSFPIQLLLGVLFVVCGIVQALPKVGGLFVGAIGVILLASIWLQIWSTELAITNRKIIAKFGLISRRTVELRIEKIESIQVHQSLLGRLFNYGTIVIAGAGNPQAPVPRIAAPLQFRREVNELIESGQLHSAR